MVWPTFLIIGAGKSGTTSLYHYLKQHPDIFMSEHKEPRYFAFVGHKPDFIGGGSLAETYNQRTVCDEAAYLGLFAGAGGYKAVGEASPAYLYFPDAPKNIRRLLPDAKLIVVLRNPVDRAFSAFSHALRDRAETTDDFRLALNLEPERIASNWGTLWRYRDMGHYADQLTRYYSVFDVSQIKVFLFEDLQKRPEWVVQECFRFVGVDPGVRVDSARVYNASSVSEGKSGLRASARSAVSKLTGALLYSLSAGRIARSPAHQRQGAPTFPMELRAELTAEFAPEINRLEKILQRDLSAWR